MNILCINIFWKATNVKEIHLNLKRGWNCCLRESTDEALVCIDWQAFNIDNVRHRAPKQSVKKLNHFVKEIRKAFLSQYPSKHDWAEDERTAKELNAQFFHLRVYFL